MRKSLFAMFAIVAAATIGVAAQKITEVHPGKGGSPHVRAEWTVDGAAISVTYGRPSLKGRAESQLMPAGRVWRTGADEQTTLVTNRELMIGNLTVPAGTYGLHTIPGEKEWTLIISKREKGWGIPYPEGQDLGRVPMTVGKTSAPVEQLTISVDDTPQGGTLRIEWGTVSARTNFMVH